MDKFTQGGKYVGRGKHILTHSILIFGDWKVNKQERPKKEQLEKNSKSVASLIKYGMDFTEDRVSIVRAFYPKV